MVMAFRIAQVDGKNATDAAKNFLKAVEEGFPLEGVQVTTEPEKVDWWKRRPADEEEPVDG